MIKSDSGNVVAWGDESVQTTATPPRYLLAATTIANPEENLQRLYDLKPKNAEKLHWRDMNPRAQRDSLRTLADLDCVTTIAVAAPLVGSKQERARRKCLEAILVELERRGVESLVLESRKPGTDKLDIDFLLHLKRSGAISAIDVAHIPGHSRPEIWIPDQVLGAYSSVVIHGTLPKSWEEPWNRMVERITMLNVGL